MNKLEKIRKCEHKWQHSTIEAKNANKDDSLWLVHKCVKCEVEVHTLIKVLKEFGVIK